MSAAAIEITVSRSALSLVAAARSRLYRELADTVRFPTPELHRRLAAAPSHEIAFPDDLVVPDELSGATARLARSRE